jgi:hypothetical protein
MSRTPRDGSPKAPHRDAHTPVRTSTPTQGGSSTPKQLRSGSSTPRKLGSALAGPLLSPKLPVSGPRLPCTQPLSHAVVAKARETGLPPRSSAEKSPRKHPAALHSPATLHSPKLHGAISRKASTSASSANARSGMRSTSIWKQAASAVQAQEARLSGLLGHLTQEVAASVDSPLLSPADERRASAD